MLPSYFSIPTGSTGYLPILREVRVPIPLMTSSQLSLPYTLTGELPDEIANALPVFGSWEETGQHALSSGGRGIILSGSTHHYRLKGVDANGSITAIVGTSKMNMIPDIWLTAVTIVKPEIALFLYAHDNLLSGRVVSLPPYKGKPFSFFFPESVENERIASDALAEAYEKAGFYAPYIYTGRIDYSSIQWQGQQVSTLIFELPSMESDLRFQELYRTIHLTLKNADREQMHEVAGLLGDFLLKVTAWYGYIAKLMNSKSLAPTDESHQPQNFSLCHVSQTEIGLGRVDHTSTKIDQSCAAEYFRKQLEDYCLFGTIHTILLHALDLERQGQGFDRTRYSNIFDAAYKWRGSFTPPQEMIAYLEDSQRAFMQGVKGNPVPIPQKDLISLFTLLDQIKK